MEIKPGSLVHLGFIQGTPIMSVNRKGSGDHWICQWFSKNGELQEGAFITEQLILVDYFGNRLNG